MRTIHGPIYTLRPYSIGNAQALTQLEMVENALRDNTKVVITEHGISPTLLLGSLPITVVSENNGHRVTDAK